MTENDHQLDKFDLQILEILRSDGRISVTDLAKKVNLSKTPCQIRMKKLQNQGFITGFAAQVNYGKINLDHVAFVEIKLLNTTEKALKEFNEAVCAIPAVTQCHMIAGTFDYLLKVRSKNIKTYRHILGEQINILPHIAHSSTYVSMESVKEE